MKAIAYPGAEGSYTEEAASLLFPHDAREALPGFDDVAAALVGGRVARAVLPIENSLAGLVPDTLLILEQGAMSIVAEVVVHIPHCLLGVAGASLETIRVVHSHPMALAQCRATLDGRFDLVGSSTTSAAARHIAELADVKVGAIASPIAARAHGLQVVLDDVSDHPENFTRFVALARETTYAHDASVPWRTAIRVVTSHEPGALHDSIEPFRYNRVRMTSLHSRPIMGEPWRYQFYIDIDGHRADPRVLRALKDVDERSEFLAVLGSYPVWAP